MNAASLDLNLIRVFLVIWDTRSLTEAGERLHLSQPAVSHALRRLRDVLDDPLFVRVGNSMVPTEAATRLHEPLHQALGLIQRTVQAHGTFDLAKVDRVFRIAMSDVSEFVLLPPLLALVRQQAPLVRLETVRLNLATVGAQLRSGEVDMALGYLPGLDDDCCADFMFMDGCVCLVRAGHPFAASGLNRDNFSQLQCVYAGLEATGHQMVERWLDSSGIRRSIALRVAHFTAAPEIVQQTDLAVLFPRSMAWRLNRRGDYCLLPLPFEVPSIEICAHTHTHFSREPGIRWLRNLALEVGAQLRDSLAGSQCLTGVVADVVERPRALNPASTDVI